MQDNILVSIVTMLILQGFKRIKSVPIQEGQMGRIRFVVAIISFFGSVGMAYTSGTELDGNLVSVFSDTIINYVMSSGWYAGVFKTKSTVIPVRI